MELNKLYRPNWFEDFVGNESAADMVKGWCLNEEIPHTVLFVGPTGVGKTTLAMILARHLRATDSHSLTRINCADSRGIDTAREIEEHLRYKPLDGKPRVWVLDEVIQLPKQTQQAMLDFLERPPDWAYFFLCKTPEGALLRTFEGRCRVVRLAEVSAPTIAARVQSVLKSLSEDRKDVGEVTGAVVKAIAESARGSVREALGLLELALSVSGEEAQLKLVGGSDPDQGNVARLCQLILGCEHKDFRWSLVTRCLGELTEPPETVRHIALAYCNKALDNNSRAAHVIRAFQYPFADSGPAGLKLACWDAVNAIRRK